MNQSNLDHFDLIQRTMKVLQAKSLMVRKRGLPNDMEQVLDHHLHEKALA